MRKHSYFRRDGYDMLIKDAGNRFDEYAYRIGTRQIADPDAYLEEGSWISLDANGKIVSADGTKLAFLCLTSNRTMRNNVAPQAVWPKASYLLGGYELTVQNSDEGNTAFDATETYGVLTPLKVVKDVDTGLGILTPYVPFTVNGEGVISGDTPEKIVAYSLGAADVTDKTLRICAR